MRKYKEYCYDWGLLRGIHGDTKSFNYGSSRDVIGLLWVPDLKGGVGHLLGTPSYTGPYWRPIVCTVDLALGLVLGL